MAVSIHIHIKIYKVKHIFAIYFFHQGKTDDHQWWYSLLKMMYFIWKKSHAYLYWNYNRSCTLFPILGLSRQELHLFLSTVVCSTNNKNLDGNTILYMYEYGTCLYARTVYVIVPYEFKIIDSKGLELAKVVFRH